ncbi:putative START-2 domain protein [Cryptosporidium felis]|nr:putative START-2 domain protein [Cryptosporidium felis]
MEEVDIKLLKRALNLYRDERVWESHVIIQELIKRYGFSRVYNLEPLISEVQRRAGHIRYFIDTLKELNFDEIEISSDFYDKKYGEFSEFQVWNSASESDLEFFSGSDSNIESELSFKSVNEGNQNVNDSYKGSEHKEEYFDQDGNLLKDVQLEECLGLITNTKPREWEYINKKDPFDLWYRSYENSTIVEICFQGFIETNILHVLSVFYERDLYKEWIPHYSFPIKFGLHSIKEILHKDKIHIVTAIYIDIPWPFSNREIILEIWASNEITPNNRIFIHASSVQDHGFHPRLKIDIPYSSDYSSRANISGGGLVSPHGENLTHLLFKWKIDLLFEPPKVLLNFFLKIFIKACWEKFNKVCLQVNKPNSLHKERLETNKELYDFIRAKINEKNASNNK